MAVQVAVACQGGGSQTAFTAGALRTILQDPGLAATYDLVALSGTSGGGICSLLAWYGLMTGPQASETPGCRAAELLDEFWHDDAARSWWDAVFINPMLVALQRLQDDGWSAQLPVPRWVTDAWRGGVKDHLRDLIARRVDMTAVPDLLRAQPAHPTLLVGAVDVLSGAFTVFEEACPDPQFRRLRPGDVPPAVSLDPILASASVPPLMAGQVIGEGCYWDGLFAHNPPIRALVGRDVAMRPDEIWVIQIDPEEADREPTSPAGIVDRRFELSSNLSLNAELHWVKQINQWVDQGILDRQNFKLIKIGRIRMGPELAAGLDLASKVDRNPDYLERLKRDGERAAAAFLAARANGAAMRWEVFPDGYSPTSVGTAAGGAPAEAAAPSGRA